MTSFVFAALVIVTLLLCPRLIQRAYAEELQKLQGEQLGHYVRMHKKARADGDKALAEGYARECSSTTDRRYQRRMQKVRRMRGRRRR